MLTTLALNSLPEGTTTDFSIVCGQDFGTWYTLISSIAKSLPLELGSEFKNCIFTLEIVLPGLIVPKFLEDTKCQAPSCGIAPESIKPNTFEGLAASTILIRILGRTKAPAQLETGPL